MNPQKDIKQDKIKVEETSFCSCFHNKVKFCGNWNGNNILKSVFRT